VKLTINFLNKLFCAQLTVSDEISRRLITRLEYIKIKPKNILCLGDISNSNFKKIKRLFPEAKLFQQTVENETNYDLVICHNYFLYYEFIDTAKQVFSHLKPNGLFLFTSLGPDSFKELSRTESLQKKLLDMHDVGDILLQTGFKNPVMDMDMLYVNISSEKKLKLIVQDFKMEQFIHVEPTATLTIEALYGHAFAPEIKTLSELNEKQEAVISFESLKQSLKR